MLIIYILMSSQTNVSSINPFQNIIDNNIPFIVKDYDSTNDQIITNPYYNIIKEEKTSSSSKKLVKKVSFSCYGKE